MKKIMVLLGIAFVLIAACMVYLVKTGVSLRTEPLIKPTEISSDHRNIADHLVLRLFREMQENHYVLWGVLPESQESQRVLSFALESYLKTFGHPVHMIRDGLSATDKELQECEKPCWLLMPLQEANELSTNSWVENKLRPLARPFFTVTWMNFSQKENVPQECETQQRLHLDCVVPLSVRDVQKKLKDPNKLYFFLRKYNDRDYFLFVQKDRP